MRISRTAIGLSLVCLLLCITGVCIKASVSVSAQPTKQAALPVIMYHAVMKDESRRSEYVLTPSQLEEVFMYIKQCGYTAVSVKQLCEFVENNVPLPEKSLLITFDDGYYNNYCYAYPLLEEHEMNAVISVIGVYTERESEEDFQSPAYSNLKWEQIREMSSSEYIEIGNHTYDMHDYSRYFGVSCPEGASEEEHESFLRSDIALLQERLTTECGEEPYIFAYPFGRYDEQSREVINSLGFKCTLSCEEGINYISYGGELEMLKRYNRSGNLSTEEFFAQIFKELE